MSFVCLADACRVPRVGRYTGVGTPVPVGCSSVTFRMWLSNKLHLWATRVYDDFHTYEWTTPDGHVIRFSHYWQHCGGWESGVRERCSCTDEDLR